MPRTSWQQALIFFVAPLFAGVLWAASPEAPAPTAALSLQKETPIASQAEPKPTMEEAAPATQPQSAPSSQPEAQPLSLFYPIKGELRRPLKDSFLDRRSGGRTHKAIDMLAKTGTPLVAAVDGFVKRIGYQYLAGRHVYIMTEDQKHVLLYAHLSRYEKGLKEGQEVKRGDIIGYVGDTGNAKGQPHLHLAIYEIIDMSRWWQGRPLNPYPLILNAENAPTSLLAEK